MATRQRAARRWAALWVLVTLGPIAAGCQLNVDSDPAQPSLEDTRSVEPDTPGGTTHTYVNPFPGNQRAGELGRAVPSDYRSITYTIPDEWEISSPYIGKHLGQPNEVALSFWTTSGIYPDACHRDGDALNPVDLSDHNHDGNGTILLANPGQGGLASQVGRGASTPTAVTVGGQLALRFVLTVPTDLDIQTCDDGVYRSWPLFNSPDSGNDNHIPGQTDIIYLVDVDRSPLIIDASYRPTAAAEDRAELESVLASLVIDR